MYLLTKSVNMCIYYNMYVLIWAQMWFAVLNLFDDLGNIGGNPHIFKKH